MVVHHPADLQIFYRYQSEAVHYMTGVLVSEILPSPRRTLVHPSYNLAPPGSERACPSPACSGRVGIELSPFPRYERNVDWVLFPGRRGGEGMEPDVNTYRLPRSGQRGRLPFTRYVTYHFPVLLLRIDTVFGVPSRGRCNTTFTGPTLDRCRVLPVLPVWRRCWRHKRNQVQGITVLLTPPAPPPAPEAPAAPCTCPR